MLAVESSIDRPPLYISEYIPSSSEENEFEEGSYDMSSMEPQLKVSDVSLQNFAIALDRCGISDRFGSLLATTLIKDLKNSIGKKASAEFNKVSDRMRKYLDGLIIDKNKIQRERTKYRAEAKHASTSDATLKCISYDGKRDKTLKKHMVENQVRLSKTTEEHITIVKEPASIFVGYATPTNGTGLEIQKSIVNFLNSEGYTFNYLVAISCDGTAVNTGYKTGVNACMERYMQRPLQWNVCMLHFNELPLKTLLTHTLGKQVGPGIWPGEIGSEILACNQYPVSLENFTFLFHTMRVLFKLMGNCFSGRKWV